MRRTSSPAKRARAVLGTLVEISIGDDRFLPAVQSAFAVIERVHRLMSRQDAASDVARINAAAPGSTLEVDPWTYEVLERARDMHLLTEGLFDCGLRDSELHGSSRVRLRTRIAVTLDGIAKGYAVDRAVEALRHAGVPTGVVNAGGDLRLFGETFAPVHVRHPASPDKLAYIGRVKDAAVATSAVNGQGATVIAADCLTADALTKPCLLAPRRAREIAQRFGAQAFSIDSLGRIH
jgi:thiamine biosynthesis lipoprotein